MKTKFLLISSWMIATAGLLIAAPVHVRTNKSADGWQLLVNETPFTVKAVSYSPDKIGEDPNIATLRNWMYVNENRNFDIYGNEIIDAPSEAFLDKNKNNLQDFDEPSVGDFYLMKAMGVNALRVYHHASTAPAVQAGYGNSDGQILQYNHPPNINLLRKLYTDHGIRTIMGDFVGAYTIGSGATWALGTNYNDDTQLVNIENSVRQMVADFKDEEFLLMYVLGNENNYSFTNTNAGDNPANARKYAEFINHLAGIIHNLDPHHPVAVCLGDTDFVTYMRDHAPNVDIYGTNAYHGPGFPDHFWDDITDVFDRPILLTEYGVLHATFTIDGELNEVAQTLEHQANWNNIVQNMAGGEKSDAAIGGVAFSWVDNWWQDGQRNVHNKNPDPNIRIQQEYHGIMSQGNGSRSPVMRQKRLVYDDYQRMWRDPPSVSFISPVPNSVISGAVNIYADARDRVTITKVEFYLDGVLLASDAVAPFVTVWDTLRSVNGNHSVTMVAYNDAGKFATASADVTVNNNLILNPKFEVGNGKTYWAFQADGTTAINTAAYVSPSRSAKIVRTTIGNSRIESTRAAVRPSTEYIGEVYIRRQNIVGALGAGAEATVNWFTASGAPIKSVAITTGLKNLPIPMWKRFTTKLKSPPGAARASITLRLRAASGHVWYDNVSLIEVINAGGALGDLAGEADGAGLEVQDVDNTPDMATIPFEDAPFALGQVYAYPNPAVRRNDITLHVEAGSADEVQVRLYDETGQEIGEKTLIEPTFMKGTWAFEHPWDLQDLSSGSYLYVVEAKKKDASPLRKTGKIAIVK